MNVNDLLLWSNRQFIYIKNYTLEQAIVQIERPACNPDLSQNLYKNYQFATPNIELRIDNVSNRKGSIAKPTYELYIGWFDTIRKFRLFYSNQKKKYDQEQIYKKDLGSVYVFGINTTLLKDENKFFRCEFSYEKDANSDTTNGPMDFQRQPRDGNKVKLPFLTTTSNAWDRGDTQAADARAFHTEVIELFKGTDASSTTLSDI